MKNFILIILFFFSSCSAVNIDYCNSTKEEKESEILIGEVISSCEIYRYNHPDERKYLIRLENNDTRVIFSEDTTLFKIGYKFRCLIDR